jgi:hypothetical protein
MGARMSNWRSTFVPAGPEMAPLGLTLEKSGQGEPGWAEFMAGRYPACSAHGAMNRVSPPPAQLWRCLNCNIGVELAA